MEHPDLGATVIDFMASTARFSNVGDEFLQNSSQYFVNVIAGCSS